MKKDSVVKTTFLDFPTSVSILRISGTGSDHNDAYLLVAPNLSKHKSSVHYEKHMPFFGTLQTKIIIFVIVIIIRMNIIIIPKEMSHIMLVFSYLSIYITKCFLYHSNHISFYVKSGVVNPHCKMPIHHIIMLIYFQHHFFCFVAVKKSCTTHDSSRLLERHV